MTIVRGSRYETALVVNVMDDDGVSRPTVYRTNFQGYNSYRLIEMAGETLEQLAGRLYGDARLWWVIADANPEIGYPDNLPAGTVIRLPSL